MPPVTARCFVAHVGFLSALRVACEQNPALFGIAESKARNWHGFAKNLRH